MSKTFDILNYEFCLSLTYQRCTPPGCKDIMNKKFTKINYFRSYSLKQIRCPLKKTRKWRKKDEGKIQCIRSVQELCHEANIFLFEEAQPAVLIRYHDHNDATVYLNLCAVLLSLFVDC